MKKTFIAFVLALIVISSSSIAISEIMLVTLLFSSTDDIELLSIKTYLGNLNNESYGDYKAILTANGKEVYAINFDPSFDFKAYREEGIVIDKFSTARVNLLIPYIEQATYLDIYYKDKIIKVFTLKDLLCNFDNICSNYETHFSCPDDCNTFSQDKVCISALDGGCDPDCPISSDPDCKTKSEKSIEEQDKKPIPLWLIITIIFAIIFAILLFFEWKRKQHEMELLQR